MLWVRRDLPAVVESRSEAPGGFEGAAGGRAMPRTTTAVSGIRGVLAKKIIWRETAVRRPSV